MRGCPRVACSPRTRGLDMLVAHIGGADTPMCAHMVYFVHQDVTDSLPQIPLLQMTGPHSGPVLRCGLHGSQVDRGPAHGPRTETVALEWRLHVHRQVAHSVPALMPAGTPVPRSIAPEPTPGWKSVADTNLGSVLTMVPNFEMV